MGLLINDRKLKAAIGSMHQFCQQVREVFPGDVDDRVVESATLHLYTSLARDLFGVRFANKLQKKLQAKLKYTTSAEAEGHIARISKHAEALDQAAAPSGGHESPEDAVRVHVTATIEAMLSDAGFQRSDPEVLKKAFDQFERAIHAMRDHLVGIREQNRFVMRTRNVA